MGEMRLVLISAEHFVIIFWNIWRSRNDLSFCGLYSECDQSIITGSSDAANQRLYEAGFDRYLEAIQAQLDNYAAGGSEAEAVPSMELAD